MKLSEVKLGVVYQIKSIANTEQKVRLLDFGFVWGRSVVLHRFDRARGALLEVEGVVVVMGTEWVTSVEVE